MVPTLRRFGDRAAVVSAREEVVAALAEARTRAVEDGGSVLTLHESPAIARLRGADIEPSERALAGTSGVEVDLGSAADSVVLRFDALGIGRFASRTIEIRRGDVTGSVVVSSYGRVRRR